MCVHQFKWISWTFRRDYSNFRAVFFIEINFLSVFIIPIISKLNSVLYSYDRNVWIYEFPNRIGPPLFLGFIYLMTHMDLIEHYQPPPAVRAALTIKFMSTLALVARSISVAKRFSRACPPLFR